MVVKDLIIKLQELPGDAWVDAMFPNEAGAYSVTGVESLTLSDGRVIAIVNINDNVPLATA
jgi:hypothetical protein